MHKIELLAPAGNFDCLIAAVQSGADAVYLAGKSFGARSFADNFDNEELEKAVDYCHLRGVKVYVTVNTLVLDDEFEQLASYLVSLSSMGVDAIIVQDLGVMELARQCVSELPIHASTQMTIHNQNGVNFLKKYDVKRVVLSRELSLEDIACIAENTNVELEVFGHGALCMCYSGQCLLSSIIGGRSGNRGKCAQPCRLPYSVNDKKDKSFVMSLKDLISLEYIQKMSKIGVSSLKIEGRMKGPAYVAAVVSVYRKYIDNPQRVSGEDFELLNSIFNRGGLTDGYLMNKHGKEMFALDKPDNPYLKGGASLEKELIQSLNGENKKTDINGKIVIKEGKKPVFSVWNDRASVSFEEQQLPEKALKTAIDGESVKLQLKKTGATPFKFESIEAEVDDGLFISAGNLNKIRRAALELFEQQLLLSYKRESYQSSLDVVIDEKINSHSYVCEVTNIKQFETIKDLSFDKIYIPIGIIKTDRKLVDEYKTKTVIVLPAILREKEFKHYVSLTKELLDSGYHGVLIHNISLINEFTGYNIYGGFRLNVFNSIADKFLFEFDLKCCELSPELTLKQIRNVKKSIPAQVMVYGRLPLTVSENCLIRNGASCPCKNENYITDRLGMRFPVIKDGDICRSVILNCKKTFMGFDMEKIINAGISSSRIYFTDETPEECIKICKTFLDDGNYRPEDFTNGHFYKGVMIKNEKNNYPL